MVLEVSVLEKMQDRAYSEPSERSKMQTPGILEKAHTFPARIMHHWKISS